MSLSASEHILKRLHGQPRVHVTHLNIVFLQATGASLLVVALVYKVYLVSRYNSIHSVLWTVAEKK